MNRNTLVTILAIIGGIVVLGWLLKVTFKLLGVVIVIGLALVVYFAIQKAREGRR